MYTQCPECAVVLSISATDLKVAGGEVGCGACNSVFNALHHLVDTDEELLPTEAVAPDLIEVASSVETTDEAEQTDAESVGSDPNLDDENVAWSRTIAGLGLADEATLEALKEYDRTHSEEPAEQTSPTDKETMEGETPSTAPAPVFELVQAEPTQDDFYDPDFDPDELLREHHQSKVMRWGLYACVGLTGVLLLLQVLHFQRNELAIDEYWGPTVQRIYNSLGLPLDPSWDVGQYDISHSGGSADPRLPRRAVGECAVV